MNEAEVLIVGAGPAGLTAATYLARFRRRVLVADGGAPRACWIPLSHNMPGFPSGIAGDAILGRMTEQAGEYGAVIEAGRVEHLTRDGDAFVARLNGRDLRVRAVLMATGVVDHHPDLPGVERAIERALVRICPICDGYEAIDKAVAVIGDDDKGVREAAFLRTYSDRVTLIHIGPAEALTEQGEMARMGIELIRAPIDNVRLEGDRVTTLSWGGTFRSFDLVYSALGTSPNADLAEGLKARVGEDGRLFVDAHQATSVKGLYAAGDVVRGLNQIAVAGAEAAVAATAIHNALREADGWTVRDQVHKPASGRDAGACFADPDPSGQVLDNRMSRGAPITPCGEPHSVRHVFRPRPSRASDPPPPPPVPHLQRHGSAVQHRRVEAPDVEPLAGVGAPDKAGA